MLVLALIHWLLLVSRLLLLLRCHLVLGTWLQDRRACKHKAWKSPCHSSNHSKKDPSGRMIMPPITEEVCPSGMAVYPCYCPQDRGKCHQPGRWDLAHWKGAKHV